MNEGRTMEESQLTGMANTILENNLSSVKISTKIEMKTGIRHTEWEIKVKNEDPMKASYIAHQIDGNLRERYGNKTNTC